MGGVCSGGRKMQVSAFHGKSTEFSGNVKTKTKFNKMEESENAYLYYNKDVLGVNSKRQDSGVLKVPFSSELKPFSKTSSKVPQVGSFLGRAGVVGFGRAVEVLDTLGSSMTNLNHGGRFISGIPPRGNKVSILAFEVANTIVKGSNIWQSISEECIHLLKKETLQSECVQHLVSTDINELLCIAAADKREEFDVFSREVIRFGKLCKDPQWHSLDRFFSKLDSDHSTQKLFTEDSESILRELTCMAQHTSELYHEFKTLDRFEQDYHRKLEEMEFSHLPPRDESFMILQSVVKHQRKLVRSLKRKSLWSKNLTEVVEKLVDMVTFLHQEILDAFGTNGFTLVNKTSNEGQTLGEAGLALHYASLINQIDNIASRPASVPSNMRDTLYTALPISVKAALRSRLQADATKEELTVTQIKAEMEKTLQWLVPTATNTTKANQGFGWVGEWATNGSEFGKKASRGNDNPIRLQTLYHANVQKTDSYILEHVAWLHRLIAQVMSRDLGFGTISSVGSGTHKAALSLNNVSNGDEGQVTQLSQQELNMLENVRWKRNVVGRSKSQGFGFVKNKECESYGLSRSAGSSPMHIATEKTHGDVLDVIDGLAFR